MSRNDGPLFSFSSDPLLRSLAHSDERADRRHARAAAIQPLVVAMIEVDADWCVGGGLEQPLMNDALVQERAAQARSSPFADCGFLSS